MKIYISVDMEGMAGITAPYQETGEKESFRRALHNQVRWIIDGIHQSCKDGEIEEITISDSHGGGTNLSYDELSQMDDRISLVSGSPRRQYMMACLDETYDVVFLAGYHAGPGERFATMDHAFSGKTVASLKINGVYMNESTANAALAGEYGVPVGLVVGDSGLKKQLIDDRMMPWVSFVVTKESLSRYAAKYRPQSRLSRETAEAVKQVLASDLTQIPRYRLEAPYTLSIEFKSTAMADMAAQAPGITRVSGTEIQAVCPTLEELETAILALTGLAGQAS